MYYDFPCHVQYIKQTGQYIKMNQPILGKIQWYTKIRNHLPTSVIICGIFFYSTTCRCWVQYILDGLVRVNIIPISLYWCGSCNNQTHGAAAQNFKHRTQSLGLLYLKHHLKIHLKIVNFYIQNYLIFALPFYFYYTYYIIETILHLYNKDNHI